MKKVTIVGAGLSGLSAAIILARGGYDVTVLEQKNEIGGAALHARQMSGADLCFADLTPLDIPAICRYLGFDISPAEDAPLPWFNRLTRTRFRVFGKAYEMSFSENENVMMVERGPRPSSIDARLFDIARKNGVNFEFGQKLRTRKDFADLPPGSIIATGMFRHAFEALDIPHTKAWGLFAGGPAPEGKSLFCVAYYDETTRDYAYYATVNGCGAAVLFQRGRPLSAAAMSWFPRQLEKDEGISFDHWYTIENIVCTPTGSLKNPRLFAGELICAGTLAGMQDPSMVLGVHGALVSGKIAAMAVTDREAALAEFARMNRWWRLGYLTRRLLWATHPWGPRRMIPAALSLQPYVAQKYFWLANPAVPGWLRLP